MPDPLYVVNPEAAIVRAGGRTDGRTGGRYLLVIRSANEEHAAGTLSLVGGKVEGDANRSDVLEETLHREILEEVGVTVDALVYVHSTLFTVDGVRVVDIVFLARYAGGAAHAADPDEVDEVLWLTADEVLAHPLAPPWTRASIQRAEAVRQQIGW